MGEIDLLMRAVEELREVDRLLDLILMALAQEQAPKEVIELFERGRDAYAEWLKR